MPKPLRTLALAIWLINVAFLHASTPTLDRIHTPITCFEDMPCWDCTTMGNLICGKDK